MILTLREYRDTTSRLRPHFDAIERALDSAEPYTSKFVAKRIEFQAQRLVENLAFGAGLYDPAHLPPWRNALLNIEQVRAEWTDPLPVRCRAVPARRFSALRCATVRP